MKKEKQEYPKDTRIIEYEISEDPVDREDFSQEALSLLEQLHDMIVEDPEDGLKACQRAIERYPDLPPFYNCLEYAYHLLGDSVRKKETTENMYARFPQYLFAKCSYAKLKINLRELDAVPGIFNGTYNLKDLYPERTVFGLNEVIIHSYTMGFYYVTKGDIDQAGKYLEIMQQLFPEHPAVEELENTINLACWRMIMEKVVATNKASKKRNAAKKAKKTVRGKQAAM